MPSIQYFNQSAPFWDFISSFEDQAFKQSFSEEKKETESTEKQDEQQQQQQQPQNPCEGANWQQRHCGRGFRRGGGHCGGGRGGGGRGFHHRGPWDMNPFVQFLQSQLNNTQADESGETNDFQPPVDVFATPSAYHIHVSLPGAKKEDVGLNYNADKSELSIAGVIYRPGDEEFLKTLEMGERKVGLFDRKVKLGNDRHRAEIDADFITAKLEDGVLRIELPRVEKDFVEVKKVDIE